MTPLALLLALSTASPALGERTPVQTIYLQPGERRWLMAARDGSWLLGAGAMGDRVRYLHPGCVRGERAWQIDPPPVGPIMGTALGLLMNFEPNTAAVHATAVCR